MATLSVPGIVVHPRTKMIANKLLNLRLPNHVIPYSYTKSMYRGMQLAFLYQFLTTHVCFNQNFTSHATANIKMCHPQFLIASTQARYKLNLHLKFYMSLIEPVLLYYLSWCKPPLLKKLHHVHNKYHAVSTSYNCSPGVYSTNLFH